MSLSVLRFHVADGMWVSASQPALLPWYICMYCGRTVLFYLTFLRPCRLLSLPPLSPFFSPSTLRLCSREEERQVGVQEGRGREWEDDKMGRWEFLHHHAGRLGFDVLLPVSVFSCVALPCLQWHIVRAAFWTVGVYTDISVTVRYRAVCGDSFFCDSASRLT